MFWPEHHNDLANLCCVVDQRCQHHKIRKCHVNPLRFLEHLPLDALRLGPTEGRVVLIGGQPHVEGGPLAQAAGEVSLLRLLFCLRHVQYSRV